MSDKDLDRRPSFVRNDALQELLHEINAALGDAEQKLDLPAAPCKPSFLVVGAPRSGTTLLMQWLANTGSVAVPSNLLSRFYAAPYLGARIQQLIADPRYNYRDELAFDAEVRSFQSDLGKTRGLLQPNEFWFFWRRFFAIEWPAPMSDEELSHTDVDGFLRGIASIELAFDKPVALKALLLQYNITFLSEILPKCVFLYTKREFADNAESLIRARLKFWGYTSRWYSAKPPGTQHLLGRSVHEQIAGQILFTQRSIELELAALPEERKLLVDYEDFCARPDYYWSQIAERSSALGVDLKPRRSPDIEFKRVSHGSGDKAAWDAAAERVRSIPPP